jgi:hypothetical protein
LSTIGLVVAGAVSTGGVTALAVKLFHTNGARKIALNSEERKNQNVDECDRSENSLASGVAYRSEETAG